MTLDFAEPALDGGASRRIDPAFRAHYLTIVRLCMRQLGDPNDAEDAAQETFRRALQQRDGVVGDPLPWLIAVARNVCIDELRRRRSGRTALERTAAAGSASQSDAEGEDNPERVVVGRMFVHELLGRLTPAERRVVAGTVMDGQSGGEVAASLGVTASTARVLLARAREKMRRYLSDGQAAMNGLVFLGWRTSMRVRHRVLARPVAMQPRVELLFPALVMTALVSSTGAPVVAPSASGSDAADRFLAAHRVAWMETGGVTRSGVAASQQGGVAHPLPAQRPAPPSGTTGAGTPIGLLMPAPKPDQVWVTDFAPSPNYRSDHTIYMVGTGSCAGWCQQLFRSSDGGATWTHVPTQSMYGPQLLIPATSYGAGRFYAAGNDLLQVTTDSGAHFNEYSPLLGFATAAPAWLRAQVVVSDVALSLIDGTQVAHPIASFGPAESAAGPALLLPSASPGGFVALQLVQNFLVGGPDTLLSCGAGGCTPMSQVPLSGNVQLLASPDFASDHTLIAVGGGVAVSRDGGMSFTLVSSKPLSQGLVLPGSRGVRLLAVDSAYGQNGNLMLMVSDDLGQTWSPAILGSARHAAYVHTPRLIAPDRLIASAADPTRPGSNVFVCSADGASWSGC